MRINPQIIHVLAFALMPTLYLIQILSRSQHLLSLEKAHGSICPVSFKDQYLIFQRITHNGKNVLSYFPCVIREYPKAWNILKYLFSECLFILHIYDYPSVFDLIIKSKASFALFCLGLALPQSPLRPWLHYIIQGLFCFNS